MNPPDADTSHTKNTRLPHCISVAHSITQPLGISSLRLIRLDSAEERGRRGWAPTRNRSRSFEGPPTGNRSPFRFGSTTSDGGGRALCSPLGWVYPVYPSGTHLSVFLPLSFSLLSFSTSSRGRRSTIDDDTRIRPGSSTDRSTERPGESVKTDEAVAMRPFYTDPHLHLLSYFFVVLLLVVVMLFLRLFAPYLPTYLPIFCFPRGPIERFLPF